MSLFPTSTPMLDISHLSHNGRMGRWRTSTMHSHDTARLIHISKGQGRITVAGLTNGYGPRNLIYIPPYTLYAIEIGKASFGHILSLRDACDWPETPVHLRVRDVERQNEMIALIEALEHELLTDTEDGRAANCYLGLICLFLQRQARLHDADARRNSGAAKLVARYTQMIARDFATHRSVSDYAAALKVTPTHLTRCCQKTCERTALGLLNDRIQYEAYLLLSETTQPVKAIAKTLGFQSPAYFTRRFQEKAGKTPSEFRRATHAAVL